MNEFKITVEIPGLAEAISNLAAALSAGQVHTVCNLHGTNNHHIDNVGTLNMDTLVVKENPTTPVQAVSTTGTAELTPVQPTAPTNAAPTAPASPDESYTLEALINAGTALVDAGKMPQLLALLGRYGVPAVTQVPKEAYSAFGAELKALGAQL